MFKFKPVCLFVLFVFVLPKRLDPDWLVPAFPNKLLEVLVFPKVFPELPKVLVPVLFPKRPPVFDVFVLLPNRLPPLLFVVPLLFPNKLVPLLKVDVALLFPNRLPVFPVFVEFPNKLEPPPPPLGP